MNVTSAFHQPNFKRPNSPPTAFHPKTRGDLTEAFKSAEAMKDIAPQSPRPTEMLTGYTFELKDEEDETVDLTASDLAFREGLLSYAYDTDPTMTKGYYEIPMTACQRFLGPGVRPDAIIKSLKRLRKVFVNFTGPTRSYRSVQMLSAWYSIENDAEKTVTIGYQFPLPVLEMMRYMPRYGYIELNAIGGGNMRSKYSLALYNHLVHEVSQRPWKEGSDNTFTISMTPERLADIVGFPLIAGQVKFARLNERVIKQLAHDLFHVQKFKVTITFDGEVAPKKGTTVKLIDFNVTVRVDDRRLTRPEFAKDRVGAPDEPRFQLNSVFYKQVSKKFKSLVLPAFAAHWVWIAALQEALDKSPLSKEFHVRDFRRERLLASIDNIGVEKTAWEFFAEEASKGADLSRSVHIDKNLRKVKVAQLDRYRKAKASVAVDEPKKPKVQKTVMSPQAVPEVVPVVAAQAPKPGAEVVPFEQCTHVELTVKEVSTTTFEMDVLNKVKNIVWFHGPRRTLRFRYLSGGGYATLDLPIMLELEQDLLDELRICKADRFIEMNEIVYLRVTK